MQTCLDFASKDTISNRKGTSMMVEFLNQSEGGLMSPDNDGGTLVSRLSMHMFSR